MKLRLLDKKLDMKSKRFVTAVKTAPQKKDTQSLSKVFSSIILLCDTPGYRMKSYGPSSLLQLKNNKKLLDTQIESIQKHFANFEIILCCGFDTDKICKYIRSEYKTLNIRIVENQIFNQTNSCESIRLALNNTNNDKVFICDGSIYFTPDLFKQYDSKVSSVFIETKDKDGFEIGLNTNELNRVEHFSFGAKYIWSEIVYLSNHDIIDGLRKLLSNTEYKNKFIFEALNDLLQTKFDLVAIKNKSKLQKINNIKVYHHFRNRL